MPLNRLDHVSIRTAKLDETERFYTEVLGMSVGPRPNFNFPGLWLYQDNLAVVHIVGIDPHDSTGLIDYLGAKAGHDGAGTGSIDHVAFAGSDIEAMRARFRATGVAFRERVVPDLNLEQVFIEDPNGVTIELNFPTAA